MNSLSGECPVCRHAGGEGILMLDCGTLDNSPLYPTVRLTICTRCGHAFNDLTAREIEGLNRYYSVEYAPANVRTVVPHGDCPGSNAALTSNRYRQVCSLLLPYIGKESAVLDVGCAMGGFLDYLAAQGYSRLAGVDMAATYVEKAREKKRFRVESGSAGALPFDDASFDAVVIEQVLEHLVDPRTAFREAKRVLRKGGILFIGVPDASRYADYFFFDYYWLLLREHIQHFDAAHLERLASQEGFTMVECRLPVHAVMSEKMVMPDVYAVFRPADDGPGRPEEMADGFALGVRLKAYIATERSRLAHKERTIAAFRDSGKPLYAWGIGREFLYLYEAAGLKHCAIAGLIDMNPLKQAAYSVGGLRIQNDSILREASAGSLLVITAVAHGGAIARTVEALGFKGSIVDWQ